MTLDQAREEYQHALRSTYVDRGEPDVGRTYNLVDEDAADALIAELEAEVERANELCIRDLEHTEKRAEQAEAEVELRDRMLRDIIERIALTPERWNGWTTEEVLADLRARPRAGT